VFYVDCKPNITISQLNKEKLPSFKLSEISSDEFTDEEMLITRIGDHPKTIVGPHVFDECLDIKQLKYALEYVNKRYMHNITKTITHDGLLYILLWRATQHLNGIERIEQREYDTPMFIADYTNKLCQIKNTLIMSPLNENFRIAIETASFIADSGAAINWIIPTPPLDGFNAPLNWMYERFYPVYSPYQLAPLSPKSTFVGPSYWAVKRENDALWMNGLLVASYAPGAEVINVGNHFRTATANGYFQFILPPGLHQTRGLDQMIVSDTLVPRLRFMCPKKEYDLQIPTSDALNIVGVITSDSFESNFIIMLDSIKNNTKLPIRCFVANPPRNGDPEGIEIIPLTTWVPPFIEKTDSIHFNSMFKHGELDFLIPTDVRKIIFVDQSVIFKEDPARLLKVNMDNASIAAPLMSSYKKFTKTALYNERDFRMERADRPYHSTRLFVVNMDIAREQGYFELYRYLYNFRRRAPFFFNGFDEEIANILQLPCQFITLPEETSVSYNINDPKLTDKAFSIFVYEPESEENLYGARKYKIMKNFVYQKYTEEKL
jgi:hypothetical protein